MPASSDLRANRPWLAVMACITIAVALDQAQGLFAPIFAACVLGVVLAPATDALKSFGVHRAVSAFGIMFLFLCSVAVAFMAAEPALSRAVLSAPDIWSEMQGLLRVVRDALAGVQQLQESVNDALTSDAAAGADGQGAEAEGDVPIPSIMDALSYGPTLVSGALIFVGTLFFFLAGREELYAQVEKGTDRLTAERLCAAERRVSRYFITISCINAGFGTLIALAMALIGMPQPLLWGLATFFLNFLLYLGPAIVALALGIVGFLTFDGFMSFVPVLIFVAVNMAEAQFVTPALVGRHMSLNPLLVFLSLVFWLWLWGPIGGLVAIPLLVWSRYLLKECRQVPDDRALLRVDA